ncbi:MAG: IS6 family transposase [Pseudonocardiales bacterium]|nr:IS6 family transposase [Pseudonocardiales bacterium]
MIAVRWYLRYGLSYRDVEELLAERNIVVDHVSIYRWVQRCTPLLIDAARPCRPVPGDRWFVDETYIKIAGQWVYLYRAIDQFGQVIDVLVAKKRDLVATRRFFDRALKHGSYPTEVNTDRAPAYVRILDEVLPGACHIVEQYANNPNSHLPSDHSIIQAEPARKHLTQHCRHQRLADIPAYQRPVQAALTRVALLGGAGRKGRHGS